MPSSIISVPAFIFESKKLYPSSAIENNITSATRTTVAEATSYRDQLAIWTPLVRLKRSEVDKVRISIETHT